VLEIAREVADAQPALSPTGLLAELNARAAAEAAGSEDGVNLLTLHRAKGLEWDSVFLPGLEEGTLPIRQAADDEALAEERRLLYVGLTRARRHLGLSWAELRVGAGDRESRRRPSRFLRVLESGPARSAPRATPGTGSLRAPRVTILPGAPIARPAPGRADDEPLMVELRAWRSSRARADGVPAYVVAHDALLAALVEQRPGSASALRRVKGMGPAKLERYGEEILAVLAGQPGRG
jgi:DNA helicase-2/ATP-dependent DNA helicase PcrA